MTGVSWSCMVRWECVHRRKMSLQTFSSSVLGCQLHTWSSISCLRFLGSTPRISFQKAPWRSPPQEMKLPFLHLQNGNKNNLYPISFLGGCRKWKELVDRKVLWEQWVATHARWGMTMPVAYSAEVSLAYKRLIWKGKFCGSVYLVYISWFISQFGTGRWFRSSPTILNKYLFLCPKTLVSGSWNCWPNSPTGKSTWWYQRGENPFTKVGLGYRQGKGSLRGRGCKCQVL